MKPLLPSGARPKLQVRGLRSAHVGPFDIDVAAAECVAIVGRSGSGKSLFLRLLADLDPGEGSVELDGRDRSTWSAPQWRRQVVFQAAEPAWWASSVAEHFQSSEAVTTQALLAALRLPPGVMQSDVARLSTGERQRLALVRSLGLRPAVLLLDEPTASLDPASVADVEALLREQMQEGRSILMVTHSREQAARLAHRTFEMIDRTLTPT